MSSILNTNNVQGYVAPGWESVGIAFEQNLTDGLDIGATLCVYYRGKCVVDLSGGWKDENKKDQYTSDTLQLVFSASKGIMAAAIALCVEKGWLDYNRPVAQYWPEFAANNKQNILLGDLLSHRAGLSFIDQPLTIEDTFDWHRMTSLLAAQKPHWKPGTEHGYHAHTIGYMGGELIRRVDPQNRSYGQFIRDELDNDFYVGVTDDSIEGRVAPLILKQDKNGTNDTSQMDAFNSKALTCNGVFPFAQPDKTVKLFNDPRVYRANLPSTNGITNAHSIARIYALLIGDVDDNNTEKKKCLLSEKTLANAIKNVTPSGEPDHSWFGLPTVFSMGGFELYSDDFKTLGDITFGHTGLGGSCALAIPSRHLVYAHICNHLDFNSVAMDPRSVHMLKTIETILNHSDEL